MNLRIPLRKKSNINTTTNDGVISYKRSVSPVNKITSFPKRISKRVKGVKPLKKLSNLFTKDILTKLGITLFIVIIYRALSSVPLPGVDMTVYGQYFGDATASQGSYLFSIFTGGQLDTPSIVGLGLVAYINASIVMQLLPYAIPRLKELQKEGERGKQVINQITRLITLPLGFFYSIAYLLYISQRDLLNVNNDPSIALDPNHSPVYLIPHLIGSNWPSIEKIIFMALILAAGTLLLMWLSEIITERGLGNGSSIIITIGILANLPNLISNDFAQTDFVNSILQFFQGNFSAISSNIALYTLMIIIGFIIVIAGIIFANESQRRVDIQYARRVRGEASGQGSFLPIKFTITGVLPVIFATSLLSIPQVIVPLISNSIESSSFLKSVVDSIQNGFLFASTDNVINQNDAIYILVYALMVIVFGLFYSFIVLNPKETAENLQKSGAFVPGIRPGKSTEQYLAGVILRISFVGSIILALIAVIPLISRDIVLLNTGFNFQLLSGIGGTSILIIVGVVLDTYRQYKSLRATRGYEKYVY